MHQLFLVLNLLQLDLKFVLLLISWDGRCHLLWFVSDTGVSCLFRVALSWAASVWWLSLLSSSETAIESTRQELAICSSLKLEIRLGRSSERKETSRRLKNFQVSNTNLEIKFHVFSIISLGLGDVGAHVYDWPKFHPFSMSKVPVDLKYWAVGTCPWWFPSSNTHTFHDKVRLFLTFVAGVGQVLLFYSTHPNTCERWPRSR